MAHRPLARLATGAVLAVAAASSPALATSPPDSGVRGLVLIGPTCPVERIRPAPECGDRPFVATLELRRSATGRLVRSVGSDRAGRFTAPLPAGLYVLTPRFGPGIARPLAERRTVRVLPHRFTNVRILYDSGIRFVAPGLRY